MWSSCGFCDDFGDFFWETQGHLPIIYSMLAIEKPLTLKGFKAVRFSQLLYVHHSLIY